MKKKRVRKKDKKEPGPVVVRTWSSGHDRWEQMLIRQMEALGVIEAAPRDSDAPEMAPGMQVEIKPLAVKEWSREWPERGWGETRPHPDRRWTEPRAVTGIRVICPLIHRSNKRDIVKVPVAFEGRPGGGMHTPADLRDLEVVADVQRLHELGDERVAKILAEAWWSAFEPALGSREAFGELAAEVARGWLGGADDDAAVGKEVEEVVGRALEAVRGLQGREIRMSVEDGDVTIEMVR